MKHRHPMLENIDRQLTEERFKMVEKPPKKQKFNLQFILLLSILSGLILAILKIIAVFS
ncbi:TPA: hypothetical protein U1C34_001965 [Streptococcus suis]|nr:hypothetical protein [Streptococcus suis]HEM3623148.1 hypothetical protein [Streptococcus suis]HEM3627381.1 hypothetical protein [Streptococcus suis]HEM3629925.1 hypothetical protein [Streptococcus suis]HEM3632013.1 hypothetical protein [Streptococcus suis]